MDVAVTGCCRSSVKLPSKLPFLDGDELESHCILLILMSVDGTGLLTSFESDFRVTLRLLLPAG